MLVTGKVLAAVDPHSGYENFLGVRVLLLVHDPVVTHGLFHDLLQFPPGKPNRVKQTTGVWVVGVIGFRRAEMGYS
jgi:hypothetical protein